VSDAVQSLIDRGVPIGGTSAGLAVLGEYVFTAAEDTVTSSQALADPFDRHVTIGANFLRIPLLRRTITDSHFHQRDRMGRTLVFLARMLHDDKLPEARGIAIDERTAALIEPDGSLRVAGSGHVYFLRVRHQPSVIEPGKPLSMSGVEVWRAGSGDYFNLKQWKGAGGTGYELRVQSGRIISSQSGGAIY
jgi:cyanophycinase